MSKAFTDASLAAIEIPVIAAAAPNPRLPAALRVARFPIDPTAISRTVEVAEAGHCSFMPLCEPGAVDLSAVEEPGDEIVCLSAGDADRGALRAAVVDATAGCLDGVWRAERR